MPKILRIINRFNLGGPTYNAAYLTKYLPAEFETLLVGGMKDDSEEPHPGFWSLSHELFEVLQSFHPLKKGVD